jgi:protein-disulfide isomerase
MSGKKFCSLIVCLGLQLLPVISARAMVETNTVLSLKSSGSPVDMAASADGHWFFVLTGQGTVEIYETSGTLKDSIKLDGPADSIASSSTGEQLFLTDKASGTIKVVAVNFIQEIETKGAPFKGPEKAPVTVILFSDFQCPYCSRVTPLLDEILKVYPTEVKVVFKNFPLQSHQVAMPAAIAALAAHRQGKFWPMHDKIFANNASLTPDKFTTFAQEIGLNLDQFAKDSADQELRIQVQQELQSGVRADVRGTPTLFVNGRRVNQRSPEGIKALIEEELKKVKK